ncbi:MAG TPA: hypothetical protein V6D23_03040 [Candidatus Obscuribacterales bacterium]
MMKAAAAILLTALILFNGCASRQERAQLESADFGLVLLDPQAARPLGPELDNLFSSASRQLGVLPDLVKGWLTPLGPALQQLRVRTLAIAQSQPERLQQALAPFRTLGRYPIVFEQVKVPADTELAPVVISANRQLCQAWRASGALWLAVGIDPLLRQESFRLNERDETSRAALGVAAASQLYLLLQARQASQGLAAELEQTQRLAGLRLEVLQARLRAEPGKVRILRDDIQLVSALIESLLKARTDLFESERRMENLLITAGDRVEAIAGSLG